MCDVLVQLLLLWGLGLLGDDDTRRTLLTGQNLLAFGSFLLYNFILNNSNFGYLEPFAYSPEGSSYRESTVFLVPVFSRVANTKPVLIFLSFLNIYLISDGFSSKKSFSSNFSVVSEGKMDR